jgi:hypothetical protein
VASARRRPPALSSFGARAAFFGYRAGSALANALPGPVASGLAHSLAVPVLLVPVLWLMLATTLLTAGQRFVKVWKQASVELPTKPPTRTTERWRAWREREASGAARSGTDWRGSGARRGSRDVRRRTPEWRRRVGGRRP